MLLALLATEQIHINVSPVPIVHTTSMASVSRGVLKAILLILTEIVWHVLQTALTAPLQHALYALVVTFCFLQQDSA
jgi:hypothetical protein